MRQWPWLYLYFIQVTISATYYWRLFIQGHNFCFLGRKLLADCLWFCNQFKEWEGHLFNMDRIKCCETKANGSKTALLELKCSGLNELFQTIWASSYQVVHSLWGAFWYQYYFSWLSWQMCSKGICFCFNSTMYIMYRRVPWDASKKHLIAPCAVWQYFIKQIVRYFKTIKTNEVEALWYFKGGWQQSSYIPCMVNTFFFLGCNNTNNSLALQYTDRRTVPAAGCSMDIMRGHTAVKTGPPLTVLV